MKRIAWIYLQPIFVLMLFSCNQQDSSPTQKTPSAHSNFQCYFFFIPDCPACRANFTKVLDLQSRFQNKGLKITAVYSDPFPDTVLLNKTIRDFKFNLPVLFDSSLVIAKKFGITVTPQFVLLDSSLKLVYSGVFDNYFYSLGKHRNRVTENYLEEAIEALIAGNLPKTPYSEPIGCKINYKFKN